MVLRPSFTWNETESTITVAAACRGAKSSTTSVFSSPHFVSLNSPPYFLELDLHAAIAVDKSVTTVHNNTVTLKLFKEAAGVWGRLMTDLPRPDRLARRERSRAAAEAQAQADADAKKKKEWDRSRFTLGAQMEQDRAARERLEERIADEKAREAAKLEQFAADARRTDVTTTRAHGAKSAAAAVPGEERSSQFPPHAAAARAESTEIFVVDDDVPALQDGGAPRARAPAPAPAPLPPPRSQSTVTIK